MRRLLIWTIAIVILTMAILPRALPWFLSIYYPDVTFRLGADEKALYLTIDDSPTPSTNEIIAVLRKHQVPATFFVIGSRIRSSPDLPNENLFRFGNHFDSTKKFGDMTAEEAKRSFSDADRFIPRERKSPWLRYPSDLGTEDLRDAIRQSDRFPILGTVYPLDHWLENETILKGIIHWMAVPGGVIIMHDGKERAPITARVLDDVIPQLRARGYEFRSSPTSGSRR